MLISSTGSWALESDKIRFYCSILGCDVESVFGVNILPSSDVSLLQEAIKDAKEPELSLTATDKLAVWKVSKRAHPDYH